MSAWQDDSAASRPDPAAGRDLEVIKRVAQPTFMHVPAGVPIAALEVVQADSSPRARALVPRVVAAYRRAMASFQAPSKSMWDAIGKEHGDFFDALERGDEDAVFEQLRNLFQSRVVWGLGHVASTVTQSAHDRDHYVRLLTDVLVSLAEMTGNRPVACIEQQGVDGWLNAANVSRADLDQIVATVTRQGVLIEAAPTSGAYGLTLAGTFVTIDSVLQGAQVLRLRQLGARPDSTIAEIGGGYGCQALMALRAGLHYHVYDLPWVNAVQGYFLCLNAPEGIVSLFGEPPAAVRVLPFWEFGSLGPRSVDFAVNSNSLPEMGHETAKWYIDRLGVVLDDAFLSVNQEAQTVYPDVGPQQRVLTLVQQAGTLRLISRHLSWMRQGYVEEVYKQPTGPLTRLAARAERHSRKLLRSARGRIGRKY